MHRAVVSERPQRVEDAQHAGEAEHERRELHPPVVAREGNIVHAVAAVVVVAAGAVGGNGSRPKNSINTRTASTMTAVQNTTNPVGRSQSTSTAKAMAAVAMRSCGFVRTTKPLGESHVQPASSLALPSQLAPARTRPRNQLASRDGPAKKTAMITITLSVNAARTDLCKSRIIVSKAAAAASCGRSALVAALR